MSAELMKLKRAVSRLTKVAINKIQYQRNFSHVMASLVGASAGYEGTNLLRFADWTRVFGTDADDEVNKNALIRKITGRVQVATNEPDQRQYSIWVVSLKDNASELLTASTGALATLTQGTHYVNTGSEVLLNLKFFNVHFHKARHLGVYPMDKAAVGTAGAVQNIPNMGEDSVQLYSFSIKCGGTRGMKVSNPAGDWKAGVYPKDPSQNYFFLTFYSADSVADAQYGSCTVNTLASVEVSG